MTRKLAKNKRICSGNGRINYRWNIIVAKLCIDVVQLPSRIQLFVTPMDCSSPGLPVPHHLKFAQVYVHCISEAIQPSHPLMPFSPSALNLSQHQGLFQWVVCSHQMTKILELQLQHPSFQWILRVDLPHNWLVWSPCCPRGFQESSAHSSKASFILVEEPSFYFLQNLSFNTSNRFFSLLLSERWVSFAKGKFPHWVFQYYLILLSFNF